MNRGKSILFSIALGILATLPSSVCAAEDSWLKAYGLGGEEYASRVVATADGGCAFVSQDYCTKLLPDGSVEWQRRIGTSDSSGAPIALAVTSDGGYITGGIGSHDGIWACKLGPAGEILWANSYSASAADSLYCAARRDGGAALCFYNYLLEGAEVIKVDAGGRALSRTVYKKGDGAVPCAIAPTADNGLIIAGMQLIYDPPKEPCWILKLTASGKVEWQRNIVGPARIHPYDIKQSPDGGYFIAGYWSDGKSRSLLMRLDAAGETLWQRSWVERDRAQSVLPLEGGGCLVAGTLQGAKALALILQFDPGGSLIFQGAMGGDGVDEAYSLAAGGGDVFACGKTDNFGPTPSSAWVMRMPMREGKPAPCAQMNDPALAVETPDLENIKGSVSVAEDVSGDTKPVVPVTYTVGALAYTRCTNACTISCEAHAAPLYGAPPLAVFFDASEETANCPAGPSFEWDFGDGSPAATERSPSHTYTRAGVFPWRLTVSANGRSCLQTGTVTITDGARLSFVKSVSLSGQVTRWAPAPGGGIYVAWTGVNQGGGVDIWLARFRGDGSPLWHCWLGGPAREELMGMQETPDGGVVLLGATSESYDGHNGPWLLKCSGEGNVQWQKRYGQYLPTYGCAIAAASGGGFLLAGSTGQTFALRLDETGSILWQKWFMRAWVSNPLAACQTSEGGFAIASHDGWVMKLSPQGELEWQKDYRWGQISDIRPLPDGGLAAVGTTAQRSGDAWVFRLDASGRAVWEYSCGSPLTEAARRVAVGEDGTCIVVGSYRSAAVGAGFLIFEIDPEGRKRWVKSYKDYIAEESWGLCIAGDGCIFAGGVSDYPERYILMRMEPGGTISGGCDALAPYEMDFMPLSPQSCDEGVTPGAGEAYSEAGTLVQSAGAFDSAEVCWGSSCALSCAAAQSSSSGTEPFSVLFTAEAAPDRCYRDTQFFWDFGDGAGASGPSVLHTYARAGVFDWRVTSSADGVDCSQNGQVLVSTKCLVSCRASASQPRAEAPAAIQFSASADLASCDGPASFFWDFGDGGSSILANPAHIYSLPGLYEWSVTATAMGASAKWGGSILIDARPTDTWSAFYSKPWDDSATNICQLPDGGFAVAGYGGLIGPGQSYGSLLRLSSGGSPSWLRLFGSQADNYLSFASASPDGCFFLAGESHLWETGDRNLTAMKLTSRGDILWQKSYGTTEGDSLLEAISSGDGLLLAGYSQGAPRSFLADLDAQGRIRWAKGVTADSQLFMSRAARADDGAILILASTEDTGVVPCVVKLDPSGNICWAKSYKTEGTSPYNSRSLCPARGGGGLIFHYVWHPEGSAGLMAVKFDGDGAVEWQRFYSAEGLYWVVSAGQLPDGNYFLAANSGQAHVDVPGLLDAGWLILLDPTGTPLWGRKYGSYYWDSIESAIPTADGGFALAGVQSLSSSVPNKDLWVVKTDKDGFIGQDCPAVTGATLDVSTPPVASSDISVTISDCSLNESDLSLLSQGILPPSDQMCGSDRTPSPRAGHSMVRLGDSVLLFGGEHGERLPEPSLEYYGDTWIYRISSGKWEEIFPAASPSKRSLAAAVECGGKGYLFFGGDSGAYALEDIWVFDPSAGTWSIVVPSNAGPAPGRKCLAASLGGAIFFMTGSGNELWSFDPVAATWTKKASPPGQIVSFSAAASIRDKIIFAGEGVNYCEMVVYIYDIGSDAWDVVPVSVIWPNNANKDLLSASDGALLWVFGGACGSSADANVWSFDPIDRTWAPRPPMVKPRMRGGAVWTGSGDEIAFLLFGGRYTDVVIGPDQESYIAEPLIYSQCQFIYEASARPLAGTSPLDVAYKASAISVEGCSSPPEVRWAFGDGATSVEPEIVHTFSGPGNYPWTFEARRDGAIVTTGGTVAVFPAPCLLEALISASPERGSAPMAVDFTAEISSSGCTGPIQAEWSFGDGSSSTGTSTRHTYTSPGIYRWEFTASAGEQICTRGGEIIALGSACDLRCPATATPASGSVPLAVTFDSHLSSAGCPAPSEATWSFGDGSTAQGTTVTHTYTKAGAFAWSFSSEAGGKSCSADGNVNVFGPIPGDCDSDGAVSIAELQKAINMFLGTILPNCGVDCDGDGAISIGELQKVINAFLGFPANC